MAGRLPIVSPISRGLVFTLMMAALSHGTCGMAIVRPACDDFSGTMKSWTRNNRDSHSAALFGRREQKEDYNHIGKSWKPSYGLLHRGFDGCYSELNLLMQEMVEKLEAAC